MKHIRYIVLVCFTTLLVNANAQPTVKGNNFDSRNGTYKGVEPSKKYGPDTAGYRICFLNDTIFAFTTFSYTFHVPENKERRGAFNYPLSFFGIGRLINHNGKKEWWGTVDIGGGTVFEDPHYTEQRIALNFLSNMVNRKPPIQSGTTVVKFNFLKNKVDVIPSRALSGFMESGLDSVRYQKIDNIPLDFTIDKKNYNNAALGIYSYLYYVGQIKQNIELRLIPIPEKVPANKNMGKLKKGEQVYLYNSYAQYTFVVKYNAQKEVVKYGWVPRNSIYNIRKLPDVKN